MEKKLNLPIKEYIETIISLAKLKVKVYFGSEVNGVVSLGRYNIYVTDGGLYSYGGWSQFIQSIYELTYNGIEVNFNRTWSRFKKTFPDDLDRNIIVEYFDPDNKYVPVVKETKVDIYIRKLEEANKPKFDIEVIREYHKDYKLKVNEFKEKVKEYMDQYPEMGYVHDEELSKNKTLALVEELYESN